MKDEEPLPKASVFKLVATGARLNATGVTKVCSPGAAIASEVAHKGDANECVMPCHREQVELRFTGTVWLQYTVNPPISPRGAYYFNPSKMGKILNFFM